jgi:hypothetical protein
MAVDLDPSRSAIIMLLFGNSVYESRLPNGNHLLPRKDKDSKFHTEGELDIIKQGTIKRASPDPAATVAFKAAQVL